MNRRVMARIAIAVLAVSLVVAAAGAASASNGKGKGKGHNDGTGHGKAHAVANTKMTFRLDDHTVAVGDPVTGPVALFTHDGNHWAPLAGATLNVLVDGVDTGTPLTTDANGDATVSITAAGAGDHVVKVVYAGDDTHRRRHRAQGFEASDTSTTSGTDGSTDGSGDTSGDTSG